jgi:hypothetical protein
MRQSDNDGIASVGVLMPLAGPGDLVTKGWSVEGEALLGLGSAVPVAGAARRAQRDVLSLGASPESPWGASAEAPQGCVPRVAISR